MLVILINLEPLFLFPNTVFIYLLLAAHTKINVLMLNKYLSQLI